MIERIRDNGTTVTLDLHGLSVDHALEVFDTAIQLSLERCRSSIKVIHGSSTSSSLYSNRTIKNELASTIEGHWASIVSSVFAMEDSVTIALPVSAPTNQKRITVSDVTP